MITGGRESATPGRLGAWQVLTASERGATHHAVGLPNQDAVAACEIGADGVAAAVADGHGHSRHFRSGRGAQLAVTVACATVAELGAELAALSRGDHPERGLHRVLVPALAARWRQAVRDDLAAQPFTPAEQNARHLSDDAVIAYGTTLLLAVAAGGWLLLAQIGDGAIVGIQPGGAALLPVPVDPSLDGRYTTSLCSPGAEHEFRVAAVELSGAPLLGVLLATDGYGNAQAVDAWEQALAADLAGLIGQRPPGWLAGQLPAWAARCASAEGSADDTTMALLLAPPASAGEGRHGSP
jgi:protein phosphatase 2C-like protein